MLITQGKRDESSKVDKSLVKKDAEALMQVLIDWSIVSV